MSLRKNSVMPKPVALRTHKCLSLKSWLSGLLTWTTNYKKSVTKYSQELNLLYHIFLTTSYNKLKMVLAIALVIIALPIFLFNFMNNDSTVLEVVNAQTPEKFYVLLFEQNKISNIDNSTKVVSAIVGHNLIKIEEELLEELSLAPTQEMEEQVSKIISNGTSGSPCNVSLTTQNGESVGINCISSGNNIIWHVYPK